MNIMQMIQLADKLITCIKELTAAVRELTEEMRKRKESNGGTTRDT